MMLPLAGSAVPSTAEELARALDSGLRGCGLISREVTGDERRLAIDLTGAEASRATRLPVGRERIGPGPEIAEFALNAEPLLFEKTPVHLRMQLGGVTTEFSRAADGALVLNVARAAGGAVDAHIFRSDLDAAVHALATEAAAKQGVQVKSTKIEVEAPSPRRLVFSVTVTVKAFVMTTTVKLRGEAHLDADLTARLAHLDVEGEGMIAGMVEGALRPQLAKIGARTFALGALVAGGLRVSDAALAVDDALRLHATLAGA